ncbi:hypothetical protein AKO1_007607 [Acrasis kona]|uniref:Uncharacterized protein n=1 Tax=Acrasis kona TaxID=1008807 RepID=A0AAW2YQI3_9EUKA
MVVIEEVNDPKNIEQDREAHKRYKRVPKKPSNINRFKQSEDDSVIIPNKSAERRREKREKEDRRIKIYIASVLVASIVLGFAPLRHLNKPKLLNRFIHTFITPFTSVFKVSALCLFGALVLVVQD